METRIVYYDETGDDGNNTFSSETFILTGIYMNSTSWSENFYKIKEVRRTIKERFGIPIGEEFHTKHFLADKNPYRKYNLSIEDKQELLIEYIRAICNLDIKIVNVIIDKSKIKQIDTYPILENALKYNIQRIENTSNNEWNYLIITDQGRIAPMRKTARAIRSYNPIQSKFDYGYSNRPVKQLIEDILDKDSKESYFIQVSDFISYFTHLFYRTNYIKKPLPNRVANVIDENFVKRVFVTFLHYDIINTKASKNKYGLVIYPK